MSRADSRAIRRPDPIALALARRRVALGLSQETVGRRMGHTNGQYVGELERGKHSPSLAALYRWADALGCEIAVREARRG